MIWSILLAASFFDAKNYKIPNQLIALGYLVGIIFNLLVYQVPGIVYFIYKACYPTVFLILLRFCKKAIGMGDIKLFSVISTMLDTDAVIYMIVASLMLAGIAIIVRCIYERRFVTRKLHYSYYIAAAFFCYSSVLDSGGLMK